MQNYLFICRSVTYAQRTARVLDSYGISAAVVRMPGNLSLNGCSYCVRVPGKRMTEALAAVKNAGLPPVQVYGRDENGNYGEVEI